MKSHTKTRKIIDLVILLIFILFINVISEVDKLNLSLMPWPNNIKINSGRFVLNNNFTISVDDSNEILYQAAYRTLKVISDKTGLFFKEQFPKINSNSMVNVNIKNIVEINLGIDESYFMEINDSSIQINASNQVGAMHAFSTLVQIIDSDSDVYYFPNVLINDKPRFQWRGLLIDVSRHFEPMEVIKRNLDALAAVKMNVFHWHLTDDQGFRIECKSFPKLHKLGSDGNYYTHEQVKEIVKYAAERGIRVVPEFDLPGHATSWLVGYPELASKIGTYNIQRNWGIFDPTFDPTNDKVYKFFEIFFSEMSTLFPDKYWHIGGDENNGKQWDANPKIQEFMKKNNFKSNHELQNYFNIKIEKILSQLNKIMVGWYTDEMPDLSKNYIVQAWKGRTSLYETAKNGYRSLLSHGFYIDLVQTTEYHYVNDPIPPDTILPYEVNEKILGGEATMWAEFVSPETIDSRIWPRTAAIAERLWSPSEVIDLKNMFERLDKVSLHLETYGLTHIKNYEMMLRRITGDYNVEIIKNFVNAIQPLYTYSRDHPHVFKSYYPLTRIVDISQPDPLLTRKFNYIIDEFLEHKIFDNQKYNLIINQLNCWKDNHFILLKLIQKRPVLKEIETLSEDLSKIAELGIQSMNFIKENKKPSRFWIQKSNEIINKAKIPKGEVEIAVIGSIEKLLKKVQ